VRGRSAVGRPGATRTIAFCPPSVIQGAPSGPTITPCGAERSPSLMWRVSPLAGSSRPSSPDAWAVYQIAPSGAGATSCGCAPRGTGYSWSAGLASCAGCVAGPDAGPTWAGAVGAAVGAGCVAGAGAAAWVGGAGAPVAGSAVGSGVGASACRDWPAHPASKAASTSAPVRMRLCHEVIM
jgi:hypothetical protein